MLRFTLYGSPHSPSTYKVALMLRLSGEPFFFRSTATCTDLLEISHDAA